MSLQAYYDAFCQGYWATDDPVHCPCRGNGWAASDVDTWHTCPIHYQGQAHPEDYTEEGAPPPWGTFPEGFTPVESETPPPLPIPGDPDDIPF